MDLFAANAGSCLHDTRMSLVYLAFVSLRGELDILRYRLEEISELEDALCKVRMVVSTSCKW